MCAFLKNQERAHTPIDNFTGLKNFRLKKQLKPGSTNQKILGTGESMLNLMVKEIVSTGEYRVRKINNWHQLEILICCHYALI